MFREIREIKEVKNETSNNTVLDWNVYDRYWERNREELKKLFEECGIEIPKKPLIIDVSEVRI